MWLHVCVDVYVSVYVHVYAGVCMYLHVYMSMYVCVDMYVYVCICYTPAGQRILEWEAPYLCNSCVSTAWVLAWHMIKSQYMKADDMNG